MVGADGVSASGEVVEFVIFVEEVVGVFCEAFEVVCGSVFVAFGGVVVDDVEDDFDVGVVEGVDEFSEFGDGVIDGVSAHGAEVVDGGVSPVVEEFFTCGGVYV